MLSGLMVLTFVLILTSCKKNEANQTETAIPIEVAPTTIVDTTAKKINPAVAKDTIIATDNEEKTEKK